MKKKVSVKHARLGMYIDSLCGSWINHPFWKRSFLLDQQKELNELLHCAVKEMWIDTDLGLDVETEEERQARAAKPQAQEADEPVAPKPPPAQEPASLTDELRRARKIHTQGRVTISEIFNSARDKQGIDLSGALILVDEIMHSTARNPNAFLSLIRPKTGGYLELHSIAVCALMIMLGRSLEMDHETLMRAGLAGLLHDIGNIGVPETLLDKPGALNDSERAVVHSHPGRGWEMLQGLHLDNEILDACLHHHERVDGRGYPDGLAAESLPVFTRMAAVCDVYDLMVSEHAKRKGMSPANAIRQMAKLQEGWFDKTVFHAFVKTMGMYPFGTLVKLKSGRVAVVEEQSKKSLTTPVVRVFYSTKMAEPLFQEWVDLSKVPDSIVSVEEADALSKELRIDLKLMSVI